MEENRRFSWTDLFIKVILVVIFVLFTVWLLSLGNKDMSNSLDVLTNNIFSQNMEKMKNVGKEYFTIERLPEKVGDVRTLTLEKMYDMKLLLELTDKNGNKCSAKNSYISIEKYEEEYRMKVFLECGEESDYIIVIMGCYDYCESDICEFDKEQEEIKELEYQYKKTTGGKWSDWGKWSEWSKVSVTKENYREVETKIGTEEYSYDKTVTDTIYAELTVICPTGYNKQDNRCVKENTSYEYTNPNACPSTYNGYTLVSQNGFTCNYSKSTTTTVEPNACPSTHNGYKLVSQNGFTCNYSKTTTTKSDTEYDLKYITTKNYSYRPSSTATHYYKVVNQDYQFSCETTCAGRTIYTVDVYEKVYKTISKTETTTTTTTCPTDKYSKVDGKCVLNGTENKTTTTTCPTGYTQSGNKCSKPVKSYDYKDLIKTCPTDYKKTSDETKCYKEISTTKTVTETREVTYYRYRIREYINGTTTYKWSSSNNDKTLLNAGYKLTGKTREKNGGK